MRYKTLSLVGARLGSQILVVVRESIRFQAVFNMMIKIGSAKKHRSYEY